MSSGNLKGVQSCHAMYYMLENWTSNLQLDALRQQFLDSVSLQTLVCTKEMNQL